MTLPGGWGSWNIIGWILIGIVGLVVVIFIAAILHAVAAEACRIIAEKFFAWRCRHGWHVPGPPARREISFYDQEEMHHRAVMQQVTKCRHCDHIIKIARPK